MSKVYIERDAVRDVLHSEIESWGSQTDEINALLDANDRLFDIPAADVVPRNAYDQVVWERDLAIEQLREDYGVGLGEKKPADVVEVKHGRCDYCKDGTSFIGAKLLLGNDGKWHRIEHCPICGAKMDGDK